MDAQKPLCAIKNQDGPYSPMWELKLAPPLLGRQLRDNFGTDGQQTLLPRTFEKHDAKFLDAYACIAMSLPLQHRKHGFIYFVIVLLTVRILLNFYGFDTVPFIGNNDEVITQDPAIYLARFGQFKSLSFHGQFIDVIASNNPPLFPWTQAILFHLAGFNEATVVLPGIFYGCLSLVLLVFSLHLIASSGLSRLWLSRIFMLVIIFDPSYLVLSRFGRVDTLANVFLSIALALILISYRNVHPANFFQASSPQQADMSDPIELGRPREPSLISGLKRPDFLMLLASLFIGLSLSTYIIHVYSFAFYVAFLLLIGRKYLRRSTLILCSIVPLLTFIVLYFAAFKDDLASSFLTYHQVSSVDRKSVV